MTQLHSLDGEESDSPQELLEDNFNPELLQLGAVHLLQHIDTTSRNQAWFPWPDKYMQLHVFLWGLSVLTVDSIPSTRMLKDLDNSLQSQYGVPSIHYQGSLSHVYYINHLPSFITQQTQPIASGGASGYVVHRYDTVKVTVNQLLLSFPHLLQTYQVDHEPDPCNIIEMLEGIVDQLEWVFTTLPTKTSHLLESRLTQMQGIWAWDVAAREMVLVVPAILAMPGDNPMQSELACHIGLQGKFFCHNCWVKGVDLHTTCEHVGGVMMGPNRDDALSSVETKSCLSESEEGSAQEDVMHQLKGKGHCSEMMQDLMDHACHFLRPNTPHTCQDTTDKLHGMFHEVASGMGKV
ncbi:hypothetical protein EDD16DRAFT_1515888 [Pisolithus croceorrhizus]|nr:hypothetical protein EDD16DRAFT_1515888 [Pisolithus croceorrhizus]